MKYIYILISLISLCMLNCKDTPESFREVSIPKDFNIYSDEDSVVNNIQTFIKQHDKTMFAIYNSDCSACLIGLSLWLRFAQKHPEVTPVFATYTEQGQRSFWLQIYTYYPRPIYIFFDKDFQFFSANKINQQHDTLIVDSTGKVIAEGNIQNKNFEKRYVKARKSKTTSY